VVADRLIGYRGGPTSEDELTEPWLRGKLQEVPAVQRAVVHALQLAKEDLQRWCGGLSDEQINARPGGLAPVAFHLRHIARSLDRLLTYAEGKDLDAEQLSAKQAEMDPGATCSDLFGELNLALARSERRVRAVDPDALEQGRGVGEDCFDAWPLGEPAALAAGSTRRTRSIAATAD